MIRKHNRRTIRRAILCAIAFSIPAVLIDARLIRAESSLESIKTLQAMSKGDESTSAAVNAMRQLGKADDVTLIQSLAAMKGATPIGRNWILGLANSLYRKTGKSQTSELTRFLSDTSQDGEARYLVFEWLTANNTTLRKELLGNMTQDSSPELRYLAIDEALKIKLDKPQLSSLFDNTDDLTGVTSCIQ